MAAGEANERVFVELANQRGGFVMVAVSAEDPCRSRAAGISGRAGEARARGWRAGLLLAAAFLLASAAPARASTAAATFAALDAALHGGDGYKDYDNDQGTLAWGESYLMAAYAAEFRATGDPHWLDKLADHAWHVLQQRDDYRGVTEYDGSSGPCWRATKYSPAGQGYCWVVHSGMIAWPMVEFVVLVGEHPELADRVAFDGVSTLGQMADLFLAAVEETVAWHDPQWHLGPAPNQGFYAGDPNATFLPAVAGKALPLNQMDAMGRTLVQLWKATGEVDYLDKAVRLGNTLRAALELDGAGAWVWNYWGDAYSAPGEDVSHGAISVDFARRLHEVGLVFDEEDMRRFGRTFMEHVYVDEDTLADHVGGPEGGVDGGSFVGQLGRWVALSPWVPSLYAVVRNWYDAHYAAGVGAGAYLLGWALLAEYEPVRVSHTFYYVDWADQGAFQHATAPYANILMQPPVPPQRAMTRVTYRSSQPVVVEQWDGAAYHAVARWPATGGQWRSVWLAYDPRWWFPYSAKQVLYQFNPGTDIDVQWPEPAAPPVPSVPPEATVHVGEAWSTQLTAAGDPPFLWSLVSAPPGMTLDALGGELAWTASGPAPRTETVVATVANDWGAAELALTLHVAPADGDGDGVPWFDDCDDANPLAAHAAPETCNGLDDDCDGAVDEGCGAVVVRLLLDADCDGTPSRGDAPLPGVPVELHGATGLVGVTATDATGRAVFEGQVAGAWLFARVPHTWQLGPVPLAVSGSHDSFVFVDTTPPPSASAVFLYRDRAGTWLCPPLPTSPHGH